ncbi:uncharacterized protein LOC116175050 [Photinus pyralis]|nr:uncharacterized protein LOC116175050 [Photinus pyralis]
MRPASKPYVLLAIALGLLHFVTPRTTEPEAWTEELWPTNYESANFTGMEETEASGNYSWSNIYDHSSSDVEDNSTKPLFTQHVNVTTRTVHLPNATTWWDLTNRTGEDGAQHVNATELLSFVNVTHPTIHLPNATTWRELTDDPDEDDAQHVNATKLLTFVNVTHRTIHRPNATTWRELTDDPGEDDVQHVNVTVSAQGTTPTVHLWEEAASNSTTTTWRETPDHPGKDNNVTESFNPDFDQPSTPSREPHQPLVYRNYGRANVTGSGWRITVYDEDDVPCLKMNLQVLINVYLVRNNPRSPPSFIQMLPTSPDELHVEGECNNGSSLVFLSCESANLTLSFDGGENGTWSLVEVELSVVNREWFEKHQICESPCDPIGLKTSPEDAWSYNSRTRCRKVDVPLKHGEGRLQAMVFLMDDFHVEPFLSTERVDFEEKKCQ